MRGYAEKGGEGDWGDGGRGGGGNEKAEERGGGGGTESGEEENDREKKNEKGYGGMVREIDGRKRREGEKDEGNECGGG